MNKEIKGEWYYCSGNFLPVNKFEPSYLQNGISVYEVLRIIRGKPLFLNDHLIRFENSLAAVHNKEVFLEYNFQHIIKELVKKNDLWEGNIKLVFNMHECIKLYVYFVPHYYPNTQQHKDGIKIVSERLERTEPGVKAVNLTMRKKTESIFKESDIYEVLLVDHHGEVTEGSKSNIFFVKDQVIYTAPVHTVLPGITRKYVFKICEEKGIKTKEGPISFSQINLYEAVFISGTSPKILPVKQIDNIIFRTNHPILYMLMDEYEKIIQADIEH